MRLRFWRSDCQRDVDAYAYLHSLGKGSRECGRDGRGSDDENGSSRVTHSVSRVDVNAVVEVVS